MVSSGRISTSLWVTSMCRRRGHWVMEIAVLLLLYVSLTTAMVVSPRQRPQTDILSPDNSVQKKIVPLVDTDKETEFTASDSRTTSLTNHQPAAFTLLKNILNKSISARSRRAVQKGCQFGTCQMHNLANTLYVMGQSNKKDQSKKAGDPNGYGR